MLVVRVTAAVQVVFQHRFKFWVQVAGGVVQQFLRRFAVCLKRLQHRDKPGLGITRQVQSGHCPAVQAVHFIKGCFLGKRHKTDGKIHFFRFVGDNIQKMRFAVAEVALNHQGVGAAVLPHPLQFTLHTLTDGLPAV